MCSSDLYTLKGSTDAAAQTRGNAGGNGCDTTSCSAPCTDMPVQNFETNQQYWAVLKRIRSLMLMFCRNIIQPAVCMQSKQRPGKLIFSCKTIDFQHIDKLSALHVVHFALRILSSKLNFAPCILCNKLKSSSWIQIGRASCRERVCQYV